MNQPTFRQPTFRIPRTFALFWAIAEAQTRTAAMNVRSPRIILFLNMA